MEYRSSFFQELLPASLVPLSKRLNYIKLGKSVCCCLLMLGVVMLAVMGAIVFLESGRRKIAVQYAKRCGWTPGLWRTKYSYSIENQYGWCHSAHFCIVDYCVSGNNYQFYSRAVGSIHWGTIGSRFVVIYDDIRWDLLFSFAFFIQLWC